MDSPTRITKNIKNLGFYALILFPYKENYVKLDG